MELLMGKHKFTKEQGEFIMSLFDTIRKNEQEKTLGFFFNFVSNLNYQSLESEADKNCFFLNMEDAIRKEYGEGVLLKSIYEHINKNDNKKEKT